jgi:D-alanine--poly(phosphoribitol) ligase subunit 1
LIRFLRPYFEEIDYSCVRYNLLGAEASQVELIKEWSNCIPEAEIYNFYGPTEATIYCTYSKFNRDRETKNVNGLMMIGKPMNGMSAIILDDNNNIADENIKGELCVSGDQLTAGYLNNPERNMQVFFEMNHDGTKKRFYKTGDLCYIDDEGDIMYCGRLDYQVKVQGYRIELGEIEFHAREFLNGRNAIAVTFENKIQNTEIALFVEGDLQDQSLLVNYLKSKIPPYMLPSKILNKETFPLNTNAKVDRIALKKMIEL